MKNSFFANLLLLAATTCFSQRIKPKKDSLQLSCILINPTYEAGNKEPGLNGEKELKLIVSSSSDTVVRAPWDLTISSVRRSEEGGYEVVAYHQDYWFWFTGVTRTVVYKNKVVKRGEAIGYLKAGDKVELLLYDFETPVDPARFIRCGDHVAD